MLWVIGDARKAQVKNLVAVFNPVWFGGFGFRQIETVACISYGKWQLKTCLQLAQFHSDWWLPEGYWSLDLSDWLICTVNASCAFYSSMSLMASAAKRIHVI